MAGRLFSCRSVEASIPPTAAQGTKKGPCEAPADRVERSNRPSGWSHATHAHSATSGPSLLAGEKLRTIGSTQCGVSFFKNKTPTTNYSSGRLGGNLAGLMDYCNPGHKTKPGQDIQRRCYERAPGRGSHTVCGLLGAPGRGKPIRCAVGSPRAPGQGNHKVSLVVQCAGSGALRPPPPFTAPLVPRCALTSGATPRDELNRLPRLGRPKNACGRERDKRDIV